MSKLLSYAEAAQYLANLGVRLSPLTLRTWVSRGRIRFYKIGAKVYFSPEVLDRLIEGSVVEPLEMKVR